MLLYILYISNFTVVATVTKGSGIFNYVAVLWKADKLEGELGKNELLLHYRNKTLSARLTFMLPNANAANGTNQMQRVQRRSIPLDLQVTTFVCRAADEHCRQIL